MKTSPNIFEEEVISVNPDKALSKVLASELISNIDYVQLETKENHPIGEISQLISYEDRFYILDKDVTKSVFCFQRDGKFLFEINRLGQGPGEYVSPQSITIDTENKVLYLYCSTPGQVLSFDLNGNYIRSVKFDLIAYNFSSIGDGYYAFFCDYNPSNISVLRDGFFPNLIITDSDFQITSVNLPFSEHINSTAITMLSCCFSTISNNELSMIVPLNDTIYHLSKDRLERAYYIDFGKKKKNEKISDLMMDPTVEVGGINTFLRVNDICNIFHYVESAHHLFFIYVHKNIIHFAFYDKKQKKLTDSYTEQTGGIPEYPVINDLDGGLFPVPYFADSNSFYGFFLPDMLLEKKDAILASSAPNKQKLLKLLDAVSEDDNPIVTIIHLK